ncbi:AlbA family DNA-binding domain-containing protein [Halomicrobium zhouii]|nr:ATP-binding protein [Halomicrobium zhouii]
MHTAGPVLWDLRNSLGPEFIVSWSEMGDDSIEDIEGVWAASLARYHATTGHSPIANFGNTVNLSGDLPNAELQERSRIEDGLRHRHIDYSNLSWDNWNEVTGSEWMGLNWSKEYAVHDEFSDPLPASPGIYRIREPESERLDYIEATRNIRNKAHDVLTEVHKDTLVSFTEMDIVASPRPNEIEVILLGAHYFSEKSIPESGGETLSDLTDKAKGFLNRSEDDDIELKKGDLDHQSTTQELVALANSGGGELFVGVSNSGEIVGVSNIDDVENIITDWVTTTIEPSLRVQTYRPEIDDTKILWVRVPPAKDRLYSANGVFKYRTGSRKDQLGWNDIEEFIGDNPQILLRILQRSEIDEEEISLSY